LMWENVGILRTESKLKENLVELKKLARLLPKSGINPELAEAKNMLLTAELITQAALKRKQSLGCHFIE